jgi:hypothetical protein
MQRRMRATAEIENWVARLNAQVNSVWHNSPAASTPRWLLGQIGFWSHGQAWMRHISGSLWRWRVPAEQ